MRRSHRCHQVATPNGLPVAWPRRGFNTPAQLNIRSRGPRLDLDLSLRTTTETLQYIQFIYTYTSCIPAKHTGIHQTRIRIHSAHQPTALDRVYPKTPSRILHTSGLLPAPPTRQPITERCPPIRDARPCAAHCWATCYPVPNSGSTRVRNTENLGGSWETLASGTAEPGAPPCEAAGRAGGRVREGVAPPR
jgi:hypothetical protein